MPDDDLITVRRDDLHEVMARAGAGSWEPSSDPSFAGVWERLTEAKDADLKPEAPPPSLPDGIWGRVELPGMRSDTGWITDGTRGGQSVLVVRDWDGRPLGEYILGPACRLVHLPTPMKPPEPPRALHAGYYNPLELDDDGPGDELDDDDCTCPPVGDSVDQCPVHGDPF